MTRIPRLMSEQNQRVICHMHVLWQLLLHVHGSWRELREPQPCDHTWRKTKWVSYRAASGIVRRNMASISCDKR